MSDHKQRVHEEDLQVHHATWQLHICAKHLDKYLEFETKYRPNTWRSVLFIYLLTL